MVNHSLRGRRAKTEGDRFELLFSRALLQRQWAVIKFPMGAKALGPNKLIKVKSPFDQLAVKSGKTVCYDLKSINQSSYGYSHLTQHQIHHLLQVLEKGNSPNIKAGYIIHFRPLGKIFYFSAHTLSSLQPKTSLSPANGVWIGNLDNIDLDCIFA